MIATKPDTATSTLVGASWLQSMSDMSLAGMRRQQQIARVIAQANAKAAEDYADHMRRLSLAEDPMTAWACHTAWLRGSWQRATDRAQFVSTAMRSA